MTTSESPVDVDELTRLANALFRALPGQESTVPTQGAQTERLPSEAVPTQTLPGAIRGDVTEPTSLDWLSDLPLSLLGAYAAPALPSDAASASQLLGGTALESTPLPVSGPPADSALRSSAVATPSLVPVPSPALPTLGSPGPLGGPIASGQPGSEAAPSAPPSPGPLPTSEELAGVPLTLTGIMGFVAGPPGVGDSPPTSTASPTALIPSGLPLAPSVQDVSEEGAPDTVRSATTQGVGLPATTTAASLSVFEFRPEMLPSLAGTSAAARPFDPYAIRRDFPILSERVNGRPLIWLDNGATTQKPQSVIDRISYFYEHENSNIHRAAHTLAARSTDAYEGAREKVRRFLNAGSTAEVVFVRGATEAINLVAKSWGVAHVGAGDEVLVTHLEHHANIVPWQQLCQQVGATLKVAPVDDTGQVILSEYERLITPRTRMVAMAHVSNALGTITPVAEMVAIAHRHGATTLVDAAQSVLHMRVDVQALDADFVVFSGHKVFAPTGIGVVYGKAGVWAVTPPWQGGGNMIADVTFERTVYQPPPSRFEAGTGNIADAVGLGAALDYVTAVGIDNVTAYEHELLQYGTAGLLSIPGLRLIGTAATKAAVLSFVLDGHSSEEVGQALDRDGIAVRAGHHCAQPILRRFGVEATVRPSLAMYNTREDLDCLVDSLRRLTSGQHRGI